MTKKLLLSLLLSLAAAVSANAHCQVPCGIYGDELKFGELEQHVETITKAATQIRELSDKDELTAQDHQQLVRWVNNKESHASKIIDEAANYFLAQRIKPDQEHYKDKLELLHHIILYSMKSKQSSGAEAPETLGKKIAAFKGLYLDHDHSHHGHKH
ncbi:superoxide dismutase [Coraliomargarita sinensis]|uniref:Superoxide dismutase n=1 Tax=Coraliomargarita sinensis TaxID=2174842 RepID=A0A317ZLB2_9BACT|nr:superoxide dismutase [Ni] [Coraliomargarita sinensis]PXA04161.1 superoxide dismutase [Coraliomargarita sinensis]